MHVRDEECMFRSEKSIFVVCKVFVVCKITLEGSFSAVPKPFGKLQPVGKMLLQQYFVEMLSLKLW